MRKRVLAVALVGLALPALALAAQPLLIRVSGRTVPVHEVVRVVHTAAGPVRVQSWSWHGGNGAAMVRVSERRGTALPTWVKAQVNALRAQMRQMQLIETALAQPRLMPALPLRVMFGQPVLLLPSQAPGRRVRFIQPMIPLRVAPLPTRVIVVMPERSVPHVAPTRHHGHHGKLV